MSESCLSQHLQQAHSNFTWVQLCPVVEISSCCCCLAAMLAIWGAMFVITQCLRARGKVFGSGCEEASHRWVLSEIAAFACFGVLASYSAGLSCIASPGPNAVLCVINTLAGDMQCYRVAISLHHKNDHCCDTYCQSLLWTAAHNPFC